MPRDGNGVYTLPGGNPVAPGTIISTTWANPTMEDLAQEMTSSLDRNGRGGMLVPFANFDGDQVDPGMTFTLQTGTGISRNNDSSGDVVMSIASNAKTRWYNDTAPAGEQRPFQIWNGNAYEPPLGNGDNPTFGNVALTGYISGRAATPFSPVADGDWGISGSATSGMQFFSQSLTNLYTWRNAIGDSRMNMNNAGDLNIFSGSLFIPATASLRFNGSTGGTRIAESTADNMTFYTAGVQAMNINGIQQVSISQTLLVNGNIQCPNTIVVGNIQVTDDASVPSGNDQGYIGVAASNGLQLTGQGTVNDVVVLNRIGTIVFRVGTGTTNSFLAGNLTLEGAAASIISDVHVISLGGAFSALSNGTGRQYATAPNGHLIYGQGTTFDVSLANQGGSIALAIPFNTVNVRCSNDLIVIASTTTRGIFLTQGDIAPNPASIWHDSSNRHRMTAGTDGYLFMNSTNATTMMQIFETGEVAVPNGPITCGSYIQVGGGPGGPLRIRAASNLMIINAGIAGWVLQDSTGSFNDLGSDAAGNVAVGRGHFAVPPASRIDLSGSGVGDYIYSPALNQFTIVTGGTTAMTMFGNDMSVGGSLFSFGSKATLADAGASLNIGGAAEFTSISLLANTTIFDDLTLGGSILGGVNISVAGFIQAGAGMTCTSLISTGNVTAFSDRRLKDNLAPIESALDKIERLVGYTYDKDGERGAGLVADDVQKVLPEAVGEHDGYLTLNDASITGLIINALNELRGELRGNP